MVTIIVSVFWHLIKVKLIAINGKQKMSLIMQNVLGPRRSRLSRTWLSVKPLLSAPYLTSLFFGWHTVMIIFPVGTRILPRKGILNCVRKNKKSFLPDAIDCWSSYWTDLVVVLKDLMVTSCLLINVCTTILPLTSKKIEEKKLDNDADSRLGDISLSLAASAFSIGYGH